MPKSDSGKKVDKLSWGDTIKNQAKQLLHGLLLLAAETNLPWNQELNLYILTFENITIETIVTFINNDNSEIENYLATITNKKDQTYRLMNRLITLDILYKTKEKHQGKGTWNFHLKLPSDKKDENLKHFCRKWKKNRPPKSQLISDKSHKGSSETDKIKSINESSHPRKLQDILNLLRSFDCQEQMELIKTNKHGGIFYTEVDQDSRNWFLWRLAKHIKKINNAKIIKIISSKYNPIYKFDYIREEIARAINLKELKDCNDEMLVQQLSEFLKTKTVVLIVDCDTLNNEEFQLLTCLCNKLWKSGKKVNSKLFLFMFLVVKKQSNSKCNQLDKKLEMKEIDRNEIEQWFTESQNIYKYYEWDKQQEIINDYGEIDDRTACTLIYRICTQIFKLKHEEFEDAAKSWKIF